MSSSGWGVHRREFGCPRTNAAFHATYFIYVEHRACSRAELVSRSLSQFELVGQCLRSKKTISAFSAVSSLIFD